MSKSKNLFFDKLLRQFQQYKNELILEMDRTGAESIWLILLINFVLAGALIYQSYISLDLAKYGLTHMLGASTIGICRELVPLIIGVIVAARAGTAFAAEIASMKITEQIDALESLATDPFNFLVLPKFWASILMMPVLTIFGWLAAFMGGFSVAQIIVGVSANAFLDSAKTFFHSSFLIIGLLKAVIFGILISLISCYCGFHPRSNDSLAVGRASTTAVVFSILGVFIINFLFALIIEY